MTSWDYGGAQHALPKQRSWLRLTLLVYVRFCT
jgi:hypothetical protein